MLLKGGENLEKVAGGMFSGAGQQSRCVPKTVTARKRRSTGKPEWAVEIRSIPGPATSPCPQGCPAKTLGGRTSLLSRVFPVVSRYFVSLLLGHRFFVLVVQAFVAENFGNVFFNSFPSCFGLFGSRKTEKVCPLPARC